jgi:predicted glycoside hydrolase/deacetylase ChbG (UPF0249 family)
MERSRMLSQLLGYAADARVLIINADDFGMCQAENVATIDGLDRGCFSSSTIMVPCPWFDAAAEYAAANRHADLGVHITHTSEWQAYKWGPVRGPSDVPSLVTTRGYFHAEVDAFHASAQLDEVERETRAQIDKALAAGIDVTHLDSHMGTCQLQAKYHELYLRLAAAYRLPVRMAGASMLRAMGLDHIIELAGRLGILSPDHFWFGGPARPQDTAAYWTEVLRGLLPGVTEIYIHAALDTPELRAMTSSWAQRQADYSFFTAAAAQKLLRDLGIELIGYRPIRELQRSLAPC